MPVSDQITAGQNLNLTCQAKLLQNQGWTGWGLSFYDAGFELHAVRPEPAGRAERGEDDQALVTRKSLMLYRVLFNSE